MFFSGALYVLAETLKGLYRNRWMCITSTGVVMVTLLMLGLFMLINFNITHITGEVKEQVELVVFIDDESGEETIARLRQKLLTHSAVQEIRYVSSAEHMRRLQGQLGGMLEGYDLFAENPLLSSYEIKTVVPEMVISLARELENYPGVLTVFYGQGYVEDLFAVTRVAQLIGLALMAGLSATAILLIAHTIKLTVLMRKREITIMKYVGATNWFIRWPFILEGFVMGFIGSILPLVALYYMYQYAVEWVVVNNLPFLSLLSAQVVFLNIATYLLPLGTGLGVLGSAFSMGRFLRV